MSDLMPAIFFGHGNPMNALSKNVYTEGWASIGNREKMKRSVFRFKELMEALSPCLLSK
jgi:4,5-DOPA dioxygenase extradiol